MDPSYAVLIRRQRRQRYWEGWTDEESYHSWGSDSISDESDYYQDDDYSSPYESTKKVLVSEVVVETEPEEKIFPSLQDLSASVVAKHLSCEDLENRPLDELLLKKIAFWSFPQKEDQVRMFARLCLKSEDEWTKGLNLASEDRVLNMRQVGFMLTATTKSIMSGRRQGEKLIKDEAKVFVTFEKQRISSSSCSNCVDNVWCPHVIATIVYRIRKAKKIPVHAPVTETLSTLSREQLQKLIQYAINKDPAAVLGSVFEYVDSIRDVNSDVNITAGAPDPTFGTGDATSSYLDLTMKQLEKNFKNELRYGYQDYASNYNISEKFRSGLYQHFVQQVPDLMSKGETDAACRVLKIITMAVFDEMKSNKLNPPQRIRWFFHDLERIWSLLIITIEGEMRADLIVSAREINCIADCSTECNFLGRSRFAEPPSVLDLPLASHNGLEGKETAPFYETLCVSLLDNKPNSFNKLIDGEDSPLESDYDEPVSVMILRMEALSLWSPEICISNLAVVILRKLMKMSKQFSILQSGENYEGEEFHPPQNIDCETVGTRQLRRGKRRKKTDSKISKKKPKVLEPTAEEQELTKEQIAFSLLYVWYRAKFKIPDLKEEVKNVVCCSALRGLEMAKLRTSAVQGTVQAKEHDLLQLLEKNVADSFDLHFHTTDSCWVKYWEMYVKTFLRCGFDFYGGGLPLALIDILIRSAKFGVRDNSVLELCATALCSSASPMSTYTIPSRNDDHINRYEFSRHYDSLVGKMMGLVRTFFLTLNPDEPLGSKLFLKLLRHLGTVTEPEFLSDAFRILKEWETKITTMDQKRVCMKMLIRCIKKCVTDFRWRSFSTWSSSIMTIMSLQCKDLGVEFLQLILPCWQELSKFFSGDRMKPLIVKMKESIDYRLLPKDVTQMVLKCFGAEYTHNEDCCELLTLFQPGDTNYILALKMIRENIKNYTANALLQIAKMECDRVEENTDRREVFTKEAFSIIQEAILKLKGYPKIYTSPLGYGPTAMTTTAAYVDWIFKQFTLKPAQSATPNSQFRKFLDLMCTSLSSTPDFLISFFKAIEKEESLLSISKDKLGPALLEAYKKRIDELLLNCTHSAYGRILKEMEKAYQYCCVYIEDGGSLFASQVLKKVCLTHKGKKKLLRLMDDNIYFGSALQNA